MYLDLTKLALETPKDNDKQEAKLHPIARAFHPYHSLGLYGATAANLGLASLALSNSNPANKKTTEELIRAANLENAGINIKEPTPSFTFGGAPKSKLLKNIMLAFQRNAFFNPGDNSISSTGGYKMSPELLAHELGHAQIHHGGGLSNLLQKARSNNKVMRLGSIAGLAGTNAAVNENDSNLQGAGKGALAGAAGGSPLLLNELEASLRGASFLGKTSLPMRSKILGGLRTIPAFASYALATTTPTAIYGALTARAKRRAAASKGQINKIAKSMELKQLIKAKKMSDESDYVHKNELIRKMLIKNPEAFRVDSRLNREYVGLTHIKSGFKIHAPKSIVPSSLMHPQIGA
jgi:hypothetical protein